ncbi:MAG TPA: hypothetical protein VJN67_24325 [Stellaceae bacterium]|nr:hypothetical protein [Stellaceae bacterium]
MSDLESAYIPYLNGQYTQPAPDDGKPHLWAQKGFQFHDLLDAINPLQHLPVISTVYRWITGDTIGNLPRIVGDALYGGIPGFVSGLFGVLVKEETGKDVGEHVVATLFGDSSSPPKRTIPAQNANQPELTTEQAAALTHATIDTAALSPVPTVAATSPAATTAATQASNATPAAPAAATPVTPPTPAVASAPVLPDHPPIPLARGMGMSVAAQAPAPAVTTSKDSPANAFLTQAAERQRQLLGSAATTPSGGRVLSARGVPLQLPPGALAQMSRPSMTVLPAVAPAAGAPPTSGPVDISQKMMDALDKYMAIQKQATAARGTQIDTSVSP